MADENLDSRTYEDFRSEILRCIDSGLDILGPISKEVVYSYLARNQMSREQIPDEPWKFTETLKKLFGRGEEVLERTIMTELRHTLGIGSDGITLVEVLAASRLTKGSRAHRRESRRRR